MKEKIMIKFLKSLFGFGSSTPVATPAVVESAPYKVPEPAATTPIPLMVEAPAESVAVNVPATKPAAMTAKPKAAKPAATKAPAKPKAAKPAATKAPAKPKGPATKKPKISIAK